MNFFKTEDFVNYGEEQWEKPCLIKPSEAAVKANEKLINLGLRVYGKVEPSSYTDFSSREHESDTHKALLINLEPIKECPHPKEKVREFRNTNFDGPVYIYECNCGARVQPKEFEEIK